MTHRTSVVWTPRKVAYTEAGLRLASRSQKRSLKPGCTVAAVRVTPGPVPGSYTVGGGVCPPVTYLQRLS